MDYEYLFDTIDSDYYDLSLVYKSKSYRMSVQGSNPVDVLPITTSEQPRGTAGLTFCE